MTKIISIEECEMIGANTEDRVFKNIVDKLNERHKSTLGLSFFDQFSIELTLTEGLMQDSFPEEYAEILSIMHEEYRALDELEQHCLFIYLSTHDVDENEIVDSMSWNFEDWMMERTHEFLSKARNNKLKS